MFFSSVSVTCFKTPHPLTGLQAGRSGNRLCTLALGPTHPPSRRFFYRDKAARAAIGGSLMLLVQNCSKICGNMVGLLHRIFIWFEFQPMPCLCVAGHTDLLLRSAGPSPSHFCIPGVISFCILVTRYEHVDSLTSALST